MLLWLFCFCGGLTRVVEALALLLASLHAAAEDRAYADTDASAARTR